jgi:hypothetical protein
MRILTRETGISALVDPVLPLLAAAGAMLCTLRDRG